MQEARPDPRPTDRIEVSNPGGLPKGMLPSDLGHKSVRRNPLIADLLHRIEFIEKAGTGIKRMREEAKKYGSPEPKFETTGFFTATFYPNPEVRRQALAATGEVTGKIGNQVATKLAPSHARSRTRSYARSLQAVVCAEGTDGSPVVTKNPATEGREEFPAGLFAAGDELGSDRNDQSQQAQEQQAAIPDYSEGERNAEEVKPSWKERMIWQTLHWMEDGSP